MAVEFKTGSNADEKPYEPTDEDLKWLEEEEDATDNS